MAKQLWKPTTILNPVPVVMVTCAGKAGKPNIITLAWVGTVNSEPPMVSISIRKSRFSYDLIKETGQFVINLATEKLARVTDYCGVKSGRDFDKFAETKLTPQKASKVKVPLIKESPVNLECVVKQVIELGSHDMFIAEIVAVNVEEGLLDGKGKLDLGKAGLVCYSHGEYWSLKEALGYFGYSVTKKKNIKRKDIKVEKPESNKDKVKIESNKVSRMESNKSKKTQRGKDLQDKDRKWQSSKDIKMKGKKAGKQHKQGKDKKQ